VAGLRWSEEAHAAWKAREARLEAARQCEELNRAIPVVGECNAQDKPRPTLKLTRPEPPEAAVLDAVLKTLRLHRRVAWCERMNSGAGRFMHPDGSTSQFIRFGFVGMSDILGQLRCGRFLAVECKRPSQHPTAEQQQFIDTVNAHGGVGFVARSADDVITQLGMLA